MCLEEKHDEFDCDFELELLLVFSFIVNYSPLGRIVEKGSSWETQADTELGNLIWVRLYGGIGERKGGEVKVSIIT